MEDTQAYERAVARLRDVMLEAKTNQGAQVTIEDRDKVLNRFQKSFSPEGVSKLDEAEFRAFLDPKNNQHWSGLQRLGSRICADMELLRDSLAILLDEDLPIEERLDEATSQVNGMHKAVATPILLVAYPDRYGVWNSISEESLKKLNIWPQFERGEPFGKRYVKINRILNGLADDLGIDLWALDMLWWALGKGDTPIPEPGADDVTDETTGDALGFGLEKHLQEFLRDNWADTSLGREWVLYSEPGDPEAGVEYPCGVGRIDLLAQHKTKPQWLVIELKRDQASDVTVGQVLRYMGWVKAHLAQPDEDVSGLVIAHESEDALQYALSAVPSVDFQRYEVRFELHPIVQPE
jgi:hypothetical protein